MSKNKNLQPTETENLIIRSDEDFVSDVFARAKKYKKKRKKAIISTISACLAVCFTIGVFAIIPKDFNNKGDMRPPDNYETVETGGSDYALIDGNYLYLSQSVSRSIFELIQGEVFKSRIIEDDCKLDNYKFTLYIGGVRYMFFEDGVFYSNKIIDDKTLTKNAESIINVAL